MCGRARHYAKAHQRSSESALLPLLPLDLCVPGGMGTAMTAEIKSPQDCATMIDVRAGVDATDKALVALLVQRFGYMRAAARIKPDRGAVRDEARKAQVIDNVRAFADAADLPPERLAAVWEELVEQSIAFELDIWDATRG